MDSRHVASTRHAQSPAALLVALLLPLFPAGAEMQRTVSPEGDASAIFECRRATGTEREDLSLAPDGWVQGEARESYTRGTVPLSLVPDWVGSRVRAVGALVWFDADADGDSDLFVGTYWANQWPPLEDYYNFIYLNTGEMLEDEPSWISSDQKHTGDAEWGYINSDLYPDLFLANGGSSLQPCQVFYGRDGLLPTTAGWQNGGGTWTTGCSLADFDRDGDTDVGTSNQGISPNPYRPTYVFRNSGTGLETTPFWQSNQVGITDAIDWGDMDGDGYPDLAVTGWVNWQTGIFRNLHTTLDADFIWTTGHPERTDKGIGWADVDGDHHPDLSVGGNGAPDWIFRNQGTLLDPEPSWASGESYTGCQDLDWVDIDRDGDLDLALIHFSTGHVRIYLNTDGVLPSIADWQYDAASSGTAIGFGDVNGDGWMDLAIGVANGPVALFLNQRLPAGVAETAAGLTPARDAHLRVSPDPMRGAWPITLRFETPTILNAVELVDLTGRRMARGLPAAAGPHRVHRITWDRSDGILERLPAGPYWLRASLRDGQPRSWSARGRIVWLGP